MTDQPLTHPMAGSVLGHIGIHAVETDDPCGPGMHLHLTPAVLEPDGHVDLGVLGVFLDLACSQAGVDRGFVHADISVHRIGKPRGTKLFVEGRTARSGKRSAVVHLDVHDDLGTRVAYSVQQVRFAGDPAASDADPERMAAFRKLFYEQFDGECTLDGRLHDMLDLVASPDGSWRMPLSAASRNGFGGLHGGVAFALVGDAAAGAAGGKTTSTLIRYLARGVVGPFRAEPTVMPHVDGGSFVRVEVHDEGADDLLIILAEAQVASVG